MPYNNYTRLLVAFMSLMFCPSICQLTCLTPTEGGVKTEMRFRSGPRAFHFLETNFDDVDVQRQHTYITRTRI